MTTTATRDRILEEGARLIHRNGYHHTGIKEILDACNVPKGSFYHYFDSKEAFGLAVIDHYWHQFHGAVDQHLMDESQPPLARLQAFFASFREFFLSNDCTLGCPVGNLAQELADTHPVFREKLVSIFRNMEIVFRTVLEDARRRGDLPDTLDIDETAAFIVDAWEGAMLRMKVESDLHPLLRFEQTLFDRILR